MGLISFLKGAGSRLFGKSDDQKEQEKAALIMSHIKSYGFNTTNLNIAVDDETVVLSGSVDTIADKNRIIVSAGNIEGISRVEDKLTVKEKIIAAEPEKAVEPEKQFYTVVAGDTLSKIAKQVYGNANKYPVIFEANKPMLKHPDKIYPGQVLVIPPVT
ncbi:MAG: peptidoglycan-binding protein LysM [Prolixibacteraceae bacterium]|nr:peptidoglycan-binding protein LysM [Prolixibacteraceae bacterium]MDD4754825.1 peptidoglycan-binding protein LysM [Prolixibacteraceae bacterium]NLO01784.1 peptidoglycan-binding protein LysM [Bacteroidales bacterium]